LPSRAGWLLGRLKKNRYYYSQLLEPNDLLNENCIVQHCSDPTIIISLKPGHAALARLSLFRAWLDPVLDPAARAMTALTSK
jgi:hypothetical protein